MCTPHAGHEGGRTCAIKHHSRRNRCACCPQTAADDDGRCVARLYADCECAFHRLWEERLVERVRGAINTSGLIRVHLLLCLCASKASCGLQVDRTPQTCCTLCVSHITCMWACRGYVPLRSSCRCKRNPTHFLCAWMLSCPACFKTQFPLQLLLKARLGLPRSFPSCMQALQRARDTPGFAQRAIQARRAYQEQAQRAAHAVTAWASQHGFETGTELRWCVLW